MMSFMLLPSIPCWIAFWTFHYDYKGYVDFGGDLCLDGDENIYVCGYGGNSSGGKDVLLIKLKASGSLEWEKAWTGTLSDSASSAIEVFAVDYKVFMLASVYNSDRDLLVAQIDSSGHVDWYDEHNRGGGLPTKLSLERQ